MIMGGLYPVTVVTGIHYMYNVIEAGMLSEEGGLNTWMPIASAANFAQCAACLAVGALLGSLMYIGATAYGVTGIPGYLTALDYPLQYTIVLAASFAVAFTLTWILWKEDEDTTKKKVQKEEKEEQEEEENPAMGYRAIRICLKQKDIFKTQLRALLRATVYGNISIMYPMITSVSEVEQIWSLLRPSSRWA